VLALVSPVAAQPCSISAPVVAAITSHPVVFIVPISQKLPRTEGKKSRG
jgi:hypothetical protein